jgi:diguanylate cyclase (GGDEF)-like protein/PAS domain S-box-containing protein
MGRDYASAPRQQNKRVANVNKVKSASHSSGPGDTLDYVLDIIREGVWDWDANSGHVARSPGWYRMLGFEIGCFEENVMTWENVIHPDDYPRVMRHFEEYTSGKCDRYEIEYRCRTAGGDYKWIRDQGKIVARNPDGTVARMIGAHLDIHEQKEAQAALEQQNRLLQQDNVTLETLIWERTCELEEVNRKLQEKIAEVSTFASTDKLTGLRNRYSFESELEREIARSRRYSSPMTLALFDIDYFKDINDDYGHSAGDTALARIGEAIGKCIRKTDIAARWGGDEFVVIFPETGLEQALAITEKLMECIREISLFNTVSLNGSFGVTQYVEGDSRDTLMRRVDDALYQAKANGRGRIETF